MAEVGCNCTVTSSNSTAQETWRQACSFIHSKISCCWWWWWFSARRQVHWLLRHLGMRWVRGGFPLPSSQTIMGEQLVQGRYAVARDTATLQLQGAEHTPTPSRPTILLLLLTINEGSLQRRCKAVISLTQRTWNPRQFHMRWTFSSASSPSPSAWNSGINKLILNREQSTKKRIIKSMIRSVVLYG